MRDEVRREFEASVVSRLALHRQGTAAEAADVALFLLSDAASFVSGSQYVGWRADVALIAHWLASQPRRAERAAGWITTNRQLNGFRG